MTDKQTVEVTVDSREPSEFVSEIVTHPEVEDYTLDELPASDLEIEGMGFERKTMTDYVSSLTEGRLEDQRRKLRQRYDVAYVLVEGDISQTTNPFESSIPSEAVRGHMASLTARENSGVRAVIPCSNSSLLADMAVRISRKHLESKDEDFIPSPVTEPDATPTERMYVGLPSVGVKRAKALHEEFPTMESLVNATHEDVKAIDGIGDRVATEIISALHNP